MHNLFHDNIKMHNFLSWGKQIRCSPVVTYITLHVTIQTIETSHRVTFGSAHHLPVVEPLGGKHLIESAQGEFPLLEDAGQSAGREAAQAPLKPQLVLLLWPELPAPKGAYHRVPTAPPLLGMT